MIIRPHERIGSPCCLKVSYDAMKLWIVEHANMVKVISLQRLVETIQGEIRKAMGMYHIMDE